MGAAAAAKKKNQLQESQTRHVRYLVLNEMEEQKQSVSGDSEPGKPPVSTTAVKSSQIIGDNLDITRNPSKMSKERQRKSWHWFLLVAVENRVTFPCLPDESPQADISVLENKAFIPSTEDCKSLDDHLKVLVKYLPCFRRFESLIPKQISHPYMNQTAKKI